MKTTLTLIAVLATALSARAQTPWANDYNTPLGSNVTVNSATPFMLATNVPTLVSRSICWSGSGTLLVTESNTLQVALINTNGVLRGGTNFITCYGKNFCVTNTLAGATNFNNISSVPAILATSTSYPIVSGQCYQSSAVYGLFRGLVLVSTTNGGSGTAYLAEGRNQ